LEHTSEIKGHCVLDSRKAVERLEQTKYIVGWLGLLLDSIGDRWPSVVAEL
jgi:hypothetical protein